MPRPLPAFEPEFALAAAVALWDDDPFAAAAGALIDQPGFDWGRFCEVACYHGVDQATQRRMAELLPGAMPAEITAEFTQVGMARSAMQAAQSSVTARLVGLLANAGVPSLALKGSALAHLLYASDPVQRTSSDIDLLVAPDTLRAADRALRAAGMIRTLPETLPPKAARPMYMKLVNVFNYRGPVYGELVELHCRPTLNPHWLPVTFEELYAQSCEVSLGGSQVRALDGPLLVEYLCQHALYCLGYRLKWIGDIVRALRRAGAADCASYVASYPARLPPEPGKLADAVLRALDAGIARSIAGAGPPVMAGRDVWRIVDYLHQSEAIPTERTLASLPIEFWYHSLSMRHLPGWRGKAHELLVAACNPVDTITLKIGPRLAPVYFVAGPVLALSRLVARRWRKPAAPAI
ncbi:MAG: nucleotidyltransferase family protein [Croceibacterium sp.]